MDEYYTLNSQYGKNPNSTEALAVIRARDINNEEKALRKAARKEKLRNFFKRAN